jgi:hypothetical protein
MVGKYLSDPTWLLTIFTLVGVIVAVVTLWLQTKSFKLTIGADLGMKLDDKFDSSWFAPGEVEGCCTDIY